jgi:hypothetical protein
MRELIALTAVYGGVFLAFRRLGGLSAAAGWMEDWGRRTAAV